MKKKIMAVLAVIAAVLGFGFATNTAMADDYGATVTYGTTTATTANTGAAIAPYGVAVVLLAAAGIALFAVRKNTTRR